jgi:hypothetical protein
MLNARLSNGDLQKKQAELAAVAPRAAVKNYKRACSYVVLTGADAHIRKENGQHNCRVESAAARVRRRSPGSVHNSGRILCPVRSPDPGRPAVRAASAAANTKRSAFRLAHSPTTPRLMPCSSALLPPAPPPKMPHRSFIVTPVPSHCRAQAPSAPVPMTRRVARRRVRLRRALWR